MPLTKEHKGITLTKLAPNVNIQEKDLLDSSNSKFLYARGFLICKENNVKITPSFQKEQLSKDYTLYFNELLEKEEYEKNGVKIVVLGLAVFATEKFFDTKKSVAETLVNEYSKSTNAFLDCIYYLSGRYVIIVIDNTSGKEKIDLFGDACCLKSVYYSKSVSAVGSHIDLVNMIAKAGLSEIEKDFEEKNYIYDYAYVGNFTKYDDIMCLSPNFKLSLNDFKETRYFPRKELKTEENLLKIKQEYFASQQMQVKGLLAKNKKLLLSLTGGLDSRASFYSTIDYKDKIYYFTEDRDRDLEKAGFVANKFNLNWIGIDSKDWHLENNKLKTGFDKIISEKVFPKTANLALHSQFILLNIFGYSKDYVHIHSNCAEIARGREKSMGARAFAYEPEEYNFEKFLQGYIDSSLIWQSPEEKKKQEEQMKNDDILISHLKKYYDHLNLTDVKKLGYNICDLAYGEQRVGQFLAQTHMKNDAIFESISLTNCQYVLDIMWKVPKQYINDSIMLYYAILNEYDPINQADIMGKNFVVSDNCYDDNNYMFTFGGKYYLKEIKDLDDKIEFLKKANSINSTMKWVYLDLIQAYILKKDFDSAFNWCLKMIEYDKNLASHWTINSTCDNLILSNKTEKCLELVDAVKKIDENIGWIYKQKAIVFKRQNETEKSLENIKKAYKLSPNDKWIANILLKYLRDAQDTKTMKEYMKNMSQFKNEDWFNEYK